MEDDKSNFERIVVAIACTRQFLDVFDYVLFEPELLREFQFAYETSDGISPDAKANVHWHVDILALSAGRLAELGVALWKHGTLGRVPEKRVKSLIKHALEENSLRREVLHPDLLAQLDD